MADQVVPLSSSDVDDFTEAITAGRAPTTPRTSGQLLVDQGDGTVASLVAVSGFAGVAKATITTVGATAITVVATALTSRRSVMLMADRANTADLYFGGSTVTADATATGGCPVLSAGESFALDIGAARLYAISTVASQKLRVLELS